MTLKKEKKLKRFKVKVLPDGRGIKPTVYTVIAVDPLDARIIAFALDSGFAKSMTWMEAGHVELVKMYTEVLK